MIARPGWNREPLNGHGETMAVSHEDAADAAIDRYVIAREKRREAWAHARFGAFAILGALLVWAVFSVAAAIHAHVRVTANSHNIPVPEGE